MSTIARTRTETPRVSVVIPTHRERGFIYETLTSVLRNIEPGDEVIIAANGSDEAYLQSLRPLAHGPVRVLELPAPGVSGARNEGARRATGEFLLLLDDDDLLFDDGLHTLRSLIAANPDWRAVVGSVELFGEGRERKWRRYPTEPVPLTASALLASSISTPGAGLMRRDAFFRSGGFDPAFTPAEDWDLWLKLVSDGPVVCLDVPTLRYRIHPQGISQNSHLMASAALRVFHKHLPMVKARSNARAVSWSMARVCHWYVPRLWRDMRQAAARLQLKQLAQLVLLIGRLAFWRIQLRLLAVLA